MLGFYMQTHHIHINGIVQGVGFRPMVYQVATQFQLQGYVQNGSDGVHIFFNATEEMAQIFFKTIKEKAPTQSKVISARLMAADKKVFEKFSILVEEEDSTTKKVLISPDTAICSLCKTELKDKENRRYRYPFITCTQCGPRYSIINKIPYERQDTSMQPFAMCMHCKQEYENVNDRRFFSQTNSCSICGISIKIIDKNDAALIGNTDEVLLKINSVLKAGGIIAVKGIGGYLLLCNANNPGVIQLLRNRKNRLTKPFAILYPSLTAVSDDFAMNEDELSLLQSKESPIVLLYPKKQVADILAIKKIAPGLNRLGIMLPNSPLLNIIVSDFGSPLIATSANISGSPIIYKDEDALAFLFEIADYIVSYNRDIIIPQDDSVVQVAKTSNQQIMLRRARGYAPSFLNYSPCRNECVLSTGAFLKSSFTLSVNGNVFISQFLGSSESYEAQLMYKNTLKHWLKMYAAVPLFIITDKHPHYFSHLFAKELAAKFNTQIKLVQHHEAHYAAVLAENDLIKSKEKVMGVIWDGTGYGTDGNIWGGEFFSYQQNIMQRISHFEYFPVIAGDKMAMEPRIAALCTTWHSRPQITSLQKKFTFEEWSNYQKLMETATFFSSSAGRVFDAVSSLLGICDKQTYEGEAALYLQVLAEDYIQQNGFVMDTSYLKVESHNYQVPTSLLMKGILTDIKKEKSKSYIAAKFHYSLVCIIGIIAENFKFNKICFSGGVFQNGLLVDWIQLEYKNKYQLYFHKNLSPNDENISFGQMVYIDNEMKSIQPVSTQKNE